MVWYGECGHRPLQLVSPAAFRHDNRAPRAHCRTFGQACSACPTSGRGRGRSRAGRGVSSGSGNNRGQLRATPCTGPPPRLDAYPTRWGGCRHASDNFCPAGPHGDHAYTDQSDADCSHGESVGNHGSQLLAPRHRRATSGRRSLSRICSLCIQYRRRICYRCATPRRRSADDSNTAPTGSQYAAACTKRQHASRGGERQ